LLKNSNFRGDHNSEDRWQPRWKFPWGLSGATDLSAYDPLLALAVASACGDNAFRAEVGFSRHLNFRLFQQYLREADMVTRAKTLYENGTKGEQFGMDGRDCLAQYPFVMVRIACRVCSRRGSYRLARLAAKFGPEISLRDLTDRFSYDCLWRAAARSKKGKSVCGVYLPDLEQPRPPDVPPGIVKLRLVKKG
jgi:hypothetical protein